MVALVVGHVCLFELDGGGILLGRFLASLFRGCSAVGRRFNW